MAKYRSKESIEVEAITFSELVEYGKQNGGNIVNGIPWSFNYKGYPITHENNECYLIPTKYGNCRMTPLDMLITNAEGEIYPCTVGLFETMYELTEPSLELKRLIEMIDYCRTLCKGE